jgi:hypothetical protein
MSKKNTASMAWEHAAEIYAERDLLVCVLARLAEQTDTAGYSAHVMETRPGRVAICVHTPAGQLAWTFPRRAKDRDAVQAHSGVFAECLADLPTTAGDWDGAKTVDRIARLKTLATNNA